MAIEEELTLLIDEMSLLADELPGVLLFARLLLPEMVELVALLLEELDEPNEKLVTTELDELITLELLELIEEIVVGEELLDESLLSVCELMLEVWAGSELLAASSALPPQADNRIVRITKPVDGKQRIEIRIDASCTAFLMCK